MRVVEVVQGLGRGGAERALLNRLKVQPPKVQTTIVNLDPSLDALDPPPDVEVRGWTRAEGSPTAFALRVVGELRPDIIVLRTPRNAIQLAKHLKRNHPNVRLIFEAHLERVSPRPVLDAVLRPLMRRANRHIDLSLPVSQRVADGDLCRGAREVRVHYLGGRVAPRGIDEATWTGTRFLVLGRLVEFKRPVWIAQQIAQVADGLRALHASVRFVGDGPLRTELTEFVKRMRIDDLVDIAGSMEDPSSALWGSDVLLIGSSLEGLPLTVFEAKLAGLRVLSTPSGGTGEVVGVDDHLLTSFDADEFQSALIAEAERGPVSEIERLRAIAGSAEFDAQGQAEKFYAMLEAQASHVRVAEVLSGPIEGGIPTTIRARLDSSDAGMSTVLFCPWTRTTETVAPAASFACPVLMNAHGLRGMIERRGQLSEMSPDVVIAHTDRDLLWAWLAIVGNREPRLVRVLHSSRIESRPSVRRLTRLILKFLGRRCDVVIAVSKDAAMGEAASFLPQAQVVYQPPNLSRMPLPGASDRRLVLASGRLVPTKGMDRLLTGVGEASASLRASGTNVVIAGDGPELEALRRRSIELGIADLVFMPGQVAAIGELLSHAQWFAQPSLQEGAGMSLVEALGSGLRCASGPVGLAPELLVDDSRHHLFASVPIADDWAQWLRQVASEEEPSLDERLMRAREWRTRFDLRETTARFYAVATGRPKIEHAGGADAC